MSFDTAMQAGEGNSSASSESRNARNHAQLLEGIANLLGAPETGGRVALPPIRGESRNAHHHDQLLAGVANVLGAPEIGGVRVSVPAIRGPPNIHDDALLPRRETSAALTAAGFPVSEATLATKAVRGGGPPYQLFGRKPLYRWGAALEWAHSRLSRPVRSSSEATAAALVRGGVR